MAISPVNRRFDGIHRTGTDDLDEFDAPTGFDVFFELARCAFRRNSRLEMTRKKSKQRGGFRLESRSIDHVWIEF